MRLVYY